MSGKAQKVYEHVFAFFEEHIFSLACASYTSDYEVAMRNALRVAHPETKLYACLFHFCQAVKKRGWKTFGFVRLVRNDPIARSIYYRLQCLPLLPTVHIRPMFISLKNEVAKLTRSSKKIFRPFLEYFERQWIERVSIVCFIYCFFFIRACVFHLTMNLIRFLLFVSIGRRKHKRIRYINANDRKFGSK